MDRKDKDKEALKSIIRLARLLDRQARPVRGDELSEVEIAEIDALKLRLSRFNGDTVFALMLELQRSGVSLVRN